MDKAIDHLETLGLSLSNLAQLCTVLSLMQDHLSRASLETLRCCFYAIADILDMKAAEIEEVVGEYYRARTGEQANIP